MGLSDKTNQNIANWAYAVGMILALIASAVFFAGLVPPKAVQRVVAVWGMGIGALAFVALLVAGWRLGHWLLYPAQLILMLVTGAIGANALVGIHSAVFDPPPPPPNLNMSLRPPGR